MIFHFKLSVIVPLIAVVLASLRLDVAASLTSMMFYDDEYALFYLVERGVRIVTGM